MKILISSIYCKFLNNTWHMRNPIKLRSAPWRSFWHRKSRSNNWMCFPESQIYLCSVLSLREFRPTGDDALTQNNCSKSSLKLPERHPLVPPAGERMQAESKKGAISGILVSNNVVAVGVPIAIGIGARNFLDIIELVFSTCLS